MAINLLLVVVVLLVIFVFLARRTQQKTEQLRQAGLYPHEGQETSADVDRLLQLGHKIDAIKVYRKLHRVGLKEAKEAVETRQRDIGLR